MPIGRTTAAYATIVVTIAGYTAMTLWYATSGMDAKRRCAYETVPVTMATPDLWSIAAGRESFVKAGPHAWRLNSTWGPCNASLIYVGSSAKSRGDERLDACGTNYVNVTVAETINRTGAIRERLRLVIGSVDCLAYLWFVHLWFVGGSWVMYAAFLSVRQQRRMFGVFRDARELVPTTGYPLNYATRVISGTFARCVYTKMARLMCETGTMRGTMCVALSEDPITFAFRNPLAGTLIALEMVVHFSAQCFVVGFTGVTVGPCSSSVAPYVRIVTWVVVGMIATIEMSTILFQGPPTTRIYADGDPNSNTVGGFSSDGTSRRRADDSGLAKLCTGCCSTVLSGIVMKAMHIALLVGLVLLLFRYEQKLQASLLGE